MLLPAAALFILFLAFLTAGIRIRSLRWVAVLSLGCAVGLAWFALFSGYYLEEAEKLDGVTEETVVICSDYSVPNDYGAVAEGIVYRNGKPYRVRMYLDNDPQTTPGDCLHGNFRYYTTTPGGQQASANRQGEGIFLMAYVGSVEKVREEGKTPFWTYPAIWRGKLSAILERSFPADTLGFAKAIFLGDRRGIDYETNTAFRLSGISHIIAVSGLHVGILCGLVYRLCLNKRHLVALIGIPVLVLFAAVTGLSPSITRAVIMQILLMIALAVGREFDEITALSFSCFVMMAVNPLVITSVSFQLSTGCMAGIFLFEESIHTWTRKLLREEDKSKRKIIRCWIARTISATLAALSLTTPLVAYYFGSISLIGVLTNLLVLWVLGAVFCGILLVCLAAWLCPALCGGIAWVISWPIRYILWVARALASFPLAAVYTQSIYIVVWLVFCYVLLAFFCMDQHRSPGPFLCCITVGLCAALCCSWLEPVLHDYEVSVLDVGQGQSILLQSQGRCFLIDCGGSSDSGTADIAAETVLSRGITHLDGIVLTHYDWDHAGGLPYFLTRVTVDWVLVPRCADSGGMREELENLIPGRVVEVSEIMDLSYEETVMTVYPPVLENSGNENSLCVLFKGEKCGTLITGDREAFGERILLKQAQLPQVDVLIAGHHGSGNSTSRELLDAVRPAYVFISVGQNRYGHPDEETLSRLYGFGCRVYRTDLNGDIVFRR